MKKIKSSLLSLLALAASTSLVVATEDMAAAKKIFAEKQDAVVWIMGVAKISITAADPQETPLNVPDQEVKVESLGTVVDTNGLVVTVLSQIDPSRDGVTARTSKGPVKIDAVSVLKEIKVILSDGTEIPAELIMKDADLDLGIIRIKTDAKEAQGVTLQTVDLKKSAAGQILDPTVTISRMGVVLNRVANVTPGYINMITKKPRVFLRASGAVSGCPTFDLTGNIIGITTRRTMKDKQSEAAIIPAADVLEIVEQAAQAKSAQATKAGSDASPETEKSK